MTSYFEKREIQVHSDKSNVHIEEAVIIRNLNIKKDMETSKLDNTQSQHVGTYKEIKSITTTTVASPSHGNDSISTVREEAAVTSTSGGLNEDTSNALRDENAVMLFQTPEQEQAYSQHVIIPDNVDSHKVKAKKATTKTSELSQDEGTISYTVSSYDYNTEYSELDPKTLTRHYGEVTPYGTLAKTDVEREYERYDSISPDELRSDSGLKSPGSNSSNFQDSFSASIYSSLLRTSERGIHKINLGEREITYVDFVPRKAKESFHRKVYLTFRDCMKQANSWLSKNQNFNVVRCESVRHRLDDAHKLNPESTTSHDRSYVIGLRLWYKLSRDSSNASKTQKLGHLNFVPRYLNPDKKQFKPTDRPYYEDLLKTIERLNKYLKDKPLPGHIIDVETVPLNYAVAYQSNGFIESDTSYCCLDFQGHWECFVIRIFYFEDDSLQTSPTLECHDFAPSPLTLPPSQPQFQPLSTLLQNANEWLKNHPEKQIFAVKTVEFPFKMKMLNNIKEKNNLERKASSALQLTWTIFEIASKGHLNTHIMSYEPTRDSVHQHTLRVLRMWVSDKQLGDANLRPSTPRRRNEEFDVLTFVPHQLTTKGCCGAQKAMFATSRDTVDRINEWLKRTGAEVIDVQTDNIERWSGSSFNLHTILPERTYNKEDYRAKLMRSALEYRITVFRVYYRPKCLGHHNEEPSDTPVKPYCCFVGCTLM